MFPFSSLWPYSARNPVNPNDQAKPYSMADAQIDQELLYNANSAAPGEPIRVTRDELEAMRNRSNADIIRDEMGKLDKYGNKTPSTVVRPGSTPPKAYINSTREILNKAMDKHTDELLALDKDIEKLTEERRQCRIALDGMQAALTHMSEATADDELQTRSEMDLVSEQALQASLNDGAE